MLHTVASDFGTARREVSGPRPVGGERSARLPRQPISDPQQAQPLRRLDEQP